MKSLLQFAFVGFFATLGFAQEPTKPAAPEKKEAPEIIEEVKEEKKGPSVIMATSLGDIHIELDPENAPLSTANFLKYVEAGYYNGTIFHRVIDGFMIQGGGFKDKEGKLEKQEVNAPIKNESEKTPSNTRGTIAMARTQILDSATAQFFINVSDNTSLDHPNNGGYATFGKVTKGMEVVDKIKVVETNFKNGMGDVPKETVTIKSVKLVK